MTALKESKNQSQEESAQASPPEAEATPVSRRSFLTTLALATFSSACEGFRDQEKTPVSIQSLVEPSFERWSDLHEKTLKNFSKKEAVPSIVRNAFENQAARALIDDARSRYETIKLDAIDSPQLKRDVTALLQYGAQQTILAIGEKLENSQKQIDTASAANFNVDGAYGPLTEKLIASLYDAAETRSGWYFNPPNKLTKADSQIGPLVLGWMDAHVPEFNLLNETQHPVRFGAALDTAQARAQIRPIEWNDALPTLSASQYSLRTLCALADPAPSAESVKNMQGLHSARQEMERVLKAHSPLRPPEDKGIDSKYERIMVGRESALFVYGTLLDRALENPAIEEYLTKEPQK